MNLNQSLMRLFSLEKDPSMRIDKDALCEDLRAWMRSPAMGLPEYSTDPIVQRRVGKMLAHFAVKCSSKAQGRFNSIQPHFLDKP